MTLLFMDGFDHYADADLLEKWTAHDTNSRSQIEAGGRSGQRLRVNTNNGWASKGIPGSPDTVIIGFAWNPRSGGYTTSTPWFSLAEIGTNYNIELKIVTGNIIRCTIRDTVSYDSDTDVWNWDSWHYVEIKVVASTGSSGSVEVRINGTPVIGPITSIQTADTLETFNHFRFFAESYTMWLDDVYICDDVGSDANDFQGDCTVGLLLPDGVGNSSDWTPSAGNNYENVDDATPDDDSTYNSGAAADLDLYALGALGISSGTIIGIQVSAYVRKDDAGTVTCRPVLRTGGANFNGAGVNLADDYDYSIMQIFEENPDTVAAWTVADINGLEAGIERTA